MLRRDLVARELLPHELVEWLVIVERANDVVAELPRMRTLGALFRVAVAVRVARDIQPVAAPAFSVGRRSEEAGDQVRNCGLRIADCGLLKCLDLFRCWWKSGKIERDAADERDGIRLRREREILF